VNIANNKVLLSKKKKKKKVLNRYGLASSPNLTGHFPFLGLIATLVSIVMGHFCKACFGFSGCQFLGIFCLQTSICGCFHLRLQRMVDTNLFSCSKEKNRAFTSFSLAQVSKKSIVRGHQEANNLCFNFSSIKIIIHSA
jgi:hypothetical protein